MAAKKRNTPRFESINLPEPERNMAMGDSVWQTGISCYLTKVHTSLFFEKVKLKSVFI